MNAKRSLIIALAGFFTLAAVGCNKDEPSPESDTTTAAAEPRVIEVRADDKGFTPSKIEIQQGQDVTLRFTRTIEDTCADRVVFPAVDIEKDLPVGQPVDIEVPTDEARSLTFQCGMGMYKSAVLVN